MPLPVIICHQFAIHCGSDGGHLAAVRQHAWGRVILAHSAAEQILDRGRREEEGGGGRRRVEVGGNGRKEERRKSASRTRLICIATVRSDALENLFVGLATQESYRQDDASFPLKRPLKRPLKLN